MPAMTINVKLKGAIFTADVKEKIRVAVTEEAIDKLTERMMLTGKAYGISGVVRRHKKTGKQFKGQGLGVARNMLTVERAELHAAVDSTLVFPRTTGSSWVGYNMAIAKSMLPRVINKTANRIVEELSVNG